MNSSNNNWQHHTDHLNKETGYYIRGFGPFKAIVNQGQHDKRYYLNLRVGQMVISTVTLGLECDLNKADICLKGIVKNWADEL